VTWRRSSLLKYFASGFTRTWWLVFALVIVLPSLVLSIVSLRLLDRMAHDEVADLVRASEATPWYYEEKMNRALEARAMHAARIVGESALRDPTETRRRLEAAGLDLFEVLALGPLDSAAAPNDARLLATRPDQALVLDDGAGRVLGTLRYRYSRSGLKTVLRECLNDRRAPWQDDSVEIFLGGPPDGRFRQDFDLHLIVRVDDPMLWERQSRTRDIRFGSVRTADGFSVELAIPWRHVGIRPAPGSAVRFDLTNNDDDDGGLREGQRTWAGYDRNWADPTELGVLRLGTATETTLPGIAIALPAHAPIQIDGHLAEADWAPAYEATKTTGRTDNLVRWQALWTADDLVIGVQVRDAHIVNDWSREDVDWVIRIVDPDGDVLLSSAPDADDVFRKEGAIDVQQLVALGPLKGSRVLFAFRDRPVSRRIDRWKVGVVALVAGMDALLGFGLWLVFRNVKRQMDLAALKSHFVATVSHEFKAPLALLRASAETLRGGRLLEPEKRRRYEGIIEAESRRLASLVDNVLSASRIEAGRAYQFAPTNVSSVVDSALGVHRLKLEQEGFDLQVSLGAELPPIAADAAALQEALSNLIDNAIKYSREQKRCRIEARVVGERVEISVTDSGLGISATDKDKLFERFYRGENEGHGEKGVGLGLSIARDIVRAHGGDVRVESAPGRGTTFTLVLPKEHAA
jgi:signal transduction histidine kinase